ncbi:MAG TPA: hypothetical protein VNV65_04985 [Candidatus Solibacter sp.]|nr:hypothetical protein [Candidatus Solibacter sp.]
MASAWGLAIFAVTLLPYLYAYATQPPGKVFNGFFFIADDAATYISKMREGAEGAWGWTDRYITSPHPQPVLLFLFYIVWGKIAALLHISLFAAYHVARLSGAIALVYAARALARAVLPVESRALATVIAVVGSGAGYLLLLVDAVVGHGSLEALDLHLPELSAFYSVIAIPHFAWAAALMAASLIQLMVIARPDERGFRLRPVVLAAGSMLLLTVIHPQMLFVLGPLALLYLVLVRAPASAWAATAVSFAVCLPLLVYYLSILSGDVVVVEWSKQWKHQAPDFVSLVFSLGLPLALAIYAVGSKRISAGPQLTLMAAWLVLVLALLYIPNPVNIQRRLIDGLYLPVAMLAASGITMLKGRMKPRAGRRMLFTAVSVSSISSLLVLAIAFRFGAVREPIIYIDRAEVDAVNWLGDHRGSGPPPGVMSDPLTGLYIPEMAGDRVFVGHYSETIDYLARSAQERAAVRTGDPGLGAFMVASDTGYLFVGPRERAAGVGPLGPELLRVYDAGGVQIYRLQLPLPGP